MKQESGFTLVELLVAMAIIGVLFSLSVTSYGVYTQKASYYVARQLMHDAQTAYESGSTNLDNPPASTSFSQRAGGPIADSEGRKLFVGLTVPRQVQMTAVYDEDCADSGCTEGSVVISPCNGSESVMWTRFGDGKGILLENIPGGGCA